MNSSPPSRRSVLRWGAGAAGALAALPALTACGQTVGAARTTRQASTRPGQKVNLVFWTWVPMQKTVDLWNRTHPDIHVEMQTIPASTQGGYQKMYSALTAGNPPDLAQVEYQDLPAFMLVNGLTDLSGYGADELRDSYVPWQWNQGVFGGRVHTIPQASGPMGLFYRRDLLAKWGIETPATWADFEKAARVAKARGGGARLSAFNPNSPAWFAAMCWQRGSHWIRTQGDTWVVGMNDDLSREVAEYWQRLVRDDLVHVEPDMSSAWYRQVQTGQVASWIGPQWGDALLRGQAPGTQGKWRVAPLPQWTAGQNASANWGGASTAVDSVAGFARLRGVPAVLGEGVVGYTPLLTRFEEDAVGKDIAEFVVDRCLAAGFWGVVPLQRGPAPPHVAHRPGLDTKGQRPGHRAPPRRLRAVTDDGAGGGRRPRVRAGAARPAAEPLPAPARDAGADGAGAAGAGAAGAARSACGRGSGGMVRSSGQQSRSASPSRCPGSARRQGLRGFTFRSAPFTRTVTSFRVGARSATIS